MPRLSDSYTDRDVHKDSIKVCTCGKSYKYGFTYDQRINFYVCANCLGVARQAYENGFRKECESCEQEYIVKRHPDRFNLCPECASKIPVRPRRTRRTD